MICVFIGILSTFLQPLPVDHHLGPSTLNIAVIEGGIAANVVAPNALATCSIRVSTTVDECWKIVEAVVRQHEGNGVKMEKVSSFEPVRCEVVDGFDNGVMSFFTGRYRRWNGDLERRIAQVWRLTTNNKR